MATSKKSGNFALVIELERHIEILLLSNDCVIVPDFGGFMAHHADARFDERDNMFIPPLRTIGFNPKLKMNDSLLAQSYVEAYDISYPEAVKRIADEVREIKERIENEGIYELHNIGTISLNEDGNYTFEPCEAGILTPNLYGLGSFEFKPLSMVKAEKENAEKQNSDIPKAKIINIDDNDEGAESKTVSIKVSLLRNIAIACIAIIAFLLIPAPLDNSETVTKAKTIDTGMLDRIMPKDVVTGTTTIKNIDIKKTCDSIAAAKQKKEIKAPEAGNTSCYVIVLASKIGKKNAEKYAETLKAQGYNEARAVSRQNSAKVVYGNYSSQKEAYNMLNKLNDKEPFKEGWVTKIN